jgi:hypothetical protein
MTNSHRPYPDPKNHEIPTPRRAPYGARDVKSFNRNLSVTKNTE